MGTKQTVTAACVALGSLLALQTPVWAARIAVIGTGHVAGALGPAFAKQGNTIVYGSRNPSRDKVAALVARTGHGASATTERNSVRGADIVVLAVPGRVAAQVTGNLGNLAGKIIIDPTNVVARGADGWLEYPIKGSGSNAELVQAAAPKAHVVKAFNTLNYHQMIDPSTAGGPITIMIAGDDPAAKATVAKLIKGMNLDVADFGPLRFARVLEEMLITWANARSHGMPFNYYLRPQTHPGLQSG